MRAASEGVPAPPRGRCALPQAAHNQAGNQNCAGSSVGLKVTGDNMMHVTVNGYIT